MIKIRTDCKKMNQDEVKQAIIDCRGIQDIGHFLNPVPEDLLPLDSLPNIQEGAEIILNGLQDLETKYLVYYDTDVDGVCSGTQMYHWLDSMGAQVNYWINTGKRHGVVDPKPIIEMKPDILIIVDSLDSDVDSYKAIAEAGSKIVILDHHNVRDQVPYEKYVTLITSAKDYGNPNLSGSGVVWKFIKYLDLQTGTRIADDMKDLCAIGIVADMMDVSEESKENRYLVYEGLENRSNKAIKKMCGTYDFNAKAVSFSIAPKINACMRMNRNQIASEFLRADKPQEIKKLFDYMTSCKQEQDELVRSILDQLEDQIEDRKDDPIMILKVEKGNNVLGLVANKIAGMIHKPVILVGSVPSDGNYLGSGRGIQNCKLNQLVWDNGGKAYGHDSAFGVEIPEESYDEFGEEIKSHADQLIIPEHFDADIKLNVFTITDELIDFIKDVSRISGSGFPEIKVAVTIRNFTVSKTKNEKHLLINYGGIDFVKWNFNDEDLYSELDFKSLLGDPVTFIGTLDRGFFGRHYSKKLIIDQIIME